LSKVINVSSERIEPPEQTTTATTTVQRRLTTYDLDDDDLPSVNDEHHLNFSTSSSTNDDGLASDATLSMEGVPEFAGKTLTLPSASGRSHQLFAPMYGGGNDSPRLTVEDIYIEAMTLDAEIRVFRRHLDTAGRKELSRIINFCRDALHRKLLLRSVEAQEGLDCSARRSVSSENLSTPTDAKPLELIAETAV